MTFTKPVQNNVPIVATMDGIPILLKVHLSNLQIPSAVARANEIKKLPSVPVNSIPNVRDVIPTIDGNDE